MRRSLSIRVLLLISLVGTLAGAATGPPEALELIGEVAEAHGGLEHWRGAPSVSWVEIWTSPTGEPGLPSKILVEQGRRRAFIEIGDRMKMAWDGEKAWSLDWQLPYPPRFYALLNYYFLNLPWVVHDPGVVLSGVGKAELPGDPVEYLTVRVTYEEGVGDTPDDYYLLYIDPESKRLRANEYIVTYAAILPEGVVHTPPHLLIYDEFRDVDGLLVPTRFTIYEEGEVYSSCEIRNWSFSRPFDEASLEMPEGAVIDESVP